MWTITHCWWACEMGYHFGKETGSSSKIYTGSYMIHSCIPRHISKRKEKAYVHQNVWPLKMYKWMIKAVLFIIAKKWKKMEISVNRWKDTHQSSSVQLLTHVWLFVNPWIASHQASLSIHQLPGFTQTHAHWVNDAIQPSHPLSSPSPPTFNLSQHQGLFHWISSSHQVARVLEFQLQHLSFQWIFRTDFR